MRSKVIFFSGIEVVVLLVLAALVFLLVLAALVFFFWLAEDALPLKKSRISAGIVKRDEKTE